jgi:hypothetical protein
MLLSWKKNKAIFWLNATYQLASQWTDHTWIHDWARRKLKEATRELIPVALNSFKEAYPEIASDPHVRYTFYPAVDPKTGYTDVMCIGETGMSIQGAMAHITVGLGLSGCVFHANANGEVE